MYYEVCLFVCLSKFPNKFEYLYILMLTFHLALLLLACWNRATKTKFVAEESLYLLIPLPYQGIYMYVCIYVYISLFGYVHEYFYTIL